MAGEIIKIQNVKKSFGESHVVKDMNLTVNDGEFLTLLGPSGCGKTTLLRMIAGFLQPDSGDILLDGKSILNIPPYKREVNTVFQSYALFQNYTVRQNIAFGLRMKKLPKKEIEERVENVIEMCQLEMLASRKPSKLSGGQQQRVAIARSLVNTPKVLLLDEPLGALDLQLRKQMQISLKRLQRKLGMTYIYVTHDQEEAMTLSDRIAVINNGKIEQLGTPSEIYGTPSTPFSARFLGESNFFEIKSTENNKFITADNIEIPAKEICLSNNSPELFNSKVELSVRPEFVKININKPECFCIEGKITAQNFMGAFSRIIVRTNFGKELVALEPSNKNKYKNMQDVFVNWNKENVQLVKIS